jgi:hypothetical protein
MAAAPAEIYHTAEDLLRMPEGGRYELWDGELKERCVGSESNWVGLNVNLALGEFVRREGLGSMFMAELSLQIVPGLRAGDVTLRAFRLPCSHDA